MSFVPLLFTSALSGALAGNVSAFNLLYGNTGSGSGFTYGYYPGSSAEPFDGLTASTGTFFKANKFVLLSQNFSFATEAGSTIGITIGGVTMHFLDTEETLTIPLPSWIQPESQPICTASCAFSTDNGFQFGLNVSKSVFVPLKVIKNDDNTRSIQLTVITYTNQMAPIQAFDWSGSFNITFVNQS